MLTQCLSYDLKLSNILVASLHPGQIITRESESEEETRFNESDVTISPEESVMGMMRVLTQLHEKHTGTFLDYKGKTCHF